VGQVSENRGRYCSALLGGKPVANLGTVKPVGVGVYGEGGDDDE